MCSRPTPRIVSGWDGKISSMVLNDIVVVDDMGLEGKIKRMGLGGESTNGGKGALYRRCSLGHVEPKLNTELFRG